MIRKRSYELLSITEKLFGKSVDATLALLAYSAGMVLIPSMRGSGSFQARIASEKFLEHVNYDVIKNALQTAWKKRYIVRKRHALPEITEAGKERLAQILPTYQEKRPWDGRLHLVTYDIPEQKHTTRDALRMHLHRLGCAKLQASVWITPYNPIDVLRTFIEDKGIGGTVIISDLGANASVGEETMEGLLMRVYHLDELNDRYKAWINDFSDNPKSFEAFIHYMAVLKDDPQLPFALLPKWWKGDVAFAIIRPVFMTIFK